MFVQKGIINKFPKLFQTRSVMEAPKRRVKDALWLREIRKEQIIFISNQLGFEYMSPSTALPTFPVTGFAYGKDGRRCVNMILEYGKKRINVPFIIDSGSPETYISMDLLKTLNLNPEEVVSTVVNIHGFPSIRVWYDHEDKRLRDVSLLGHEFFDQTLVYEDYDPKTKIVTLYKCREDFLRLVNEKAIK